MSAANQRCLKGIQCGGSPPVAGNRAGNSRNTMKSGMASWYCPSRLMFIIMYIPRQ